MRLVRLWAPSPREARPIFLSRVPEDRPGEPSELAGPLLFLAPAASDFYPGHTLYADGGYTAGEAMAGTARIAVIGAGMMGAASPRCLRGPDGPSAAPPC